MHAPDANDRDTDFAASASDSYSRLRDLFAAAAELGGEQRARWIAANVSDAEERAALEKLLGADDCEIGYLEIPLDEHAARMSVDEPLRAEGLIGQRFGAFRLTELIGKGGMAVVFLGRREDGDFEQRVAVKVLRRGLYSEVEQRLFRRERQLLATLEHPNIARVIDGGLTPAGVPYLVIEYVDGVSITAYAAQQMLDVRERLRLFLVVCRAVEAAHRALIVHRDIKPSNILVSTDANVKLLDFGIAKLLEDDTESATIGVFTPEYAAPEQLANAPVTTATDVYALGVLLHELLLGVRPQGTPMRRPSTLAGSVTRHLSVPRPGTLARELRGDIDTIVLKCLAEEADRRYASAGTLADDIERHLAGRPVEAHPPSRWYRARKFLSRHRGSVAITTALVVAVFAGLAAALWQANVAKYEAARANRVRDFMEDMFAPIENSVIEAKQTSVHDLLANATKKLNGDAELDTAERIDLQLLFSRLHEKMGEPDQAQKLAQAAAEVAASKLPAGDPRALGAEIAYAYALLEHDDRAKAEPMLKSLEARIGNSKALGSESLVLLYDGLAEIADMDGSHEVALGYERNALAARIARAGPDSASAATGYNNLAISLDLGGHHDEAIDAFRNSFAAHLKQEGPDSLETANARNNLAMAELQAGHLQQARTDYLAGESLYEAAPNNKRNRNARYWQDRCQLAIAIGGADLRSTCEHSIRITQDLIAPGDVAWHARAQRLDAYAKLELGDLDGARQSLQKADDLLTPAGNPAALASDDYLHGELDVARGDPAAAAKSYAHAVEHIGHGFPENLRLRALAGLAMVCANASYPECPADSGQARRELDSSADLWNPWLLPAHVAISRVDFDTGHIDAAIARLQSAIVHARPEVDRAQVHLLSAHAWLAVADAMSGRCPQASAEWQVVRDGTHEVDPHDTPLLAPAATVLSESTCGTSLR